MTKKISILVLSLLSFCAINAADRGDASAGDASASERSSAEQLTADLNTITHYYENSEAMAHGVYHGLAEDAYRACQTELLEIRTLLTNLLIRAPKEYQEIRERAQNLLMDIELTSLALEGARVTPEEAKKTMAHFELIPQ